MCYAGDPTTNTRSTRDTEKFAFVSYLHHTRNPTTVEHGHNSYPVSEMAPKVSEMYINQHRSYKGTQTH